MDVSRQGPKHKKKREQTGGGGDIEDKEKQQIECLRFQVLGFIFKV